MPQTTPTDAVTAPRYFKVMNIQGALLAAAFLAPPLSAWAGLPGSVMGQLQSVGQLFDSFGWNAHICATASGCGLYANPAEVIRQYRFVGMTGPIRTRGDDASAIPNLRPLCAAGIKLQLLHHLSPSITVEQALEQAYPGCVYAAEGPNEINTAYYAINTYLGYQGVAAAVEIQKELWRNIQAFKPSIPVLTFSNSVGIPVAGGDMSDYASPDGGNAHAYIRGGADPYGIGGNSMQEIYNQIGVVCPRCQYEISEDGNSTQTWYALAPPQPATESRVPEATAGKLELMRLFDTNLRGAYLFLSYQLMDPVPYSSSGCAGDNIECGYGAFNANTGIAPAVPKKPAQYLANVAAIMKQKGSPLYQKRLAVAWSGLAQGQYGLQFLSWDGYWLVVLDERQPSVWNAATQSNNPITPTYPTVTFPAGQTWDVSLYDPTIGTSGISAPQAARSSYKLPVGVTDHPLLIHITPHKG